MFALRGEHLMLLSHEETALLVDVSLVVPSEGPIGWLRRLRACEEAQSFGLEVQKGAGVLGDESIAPDVDLSLLLENCLLLFVLNGERVHLSRRRKLHCEV